MCNMTTAALTWLQPNSVRQRLPNNISSSQLSYHLKLESISSKDQCLVLFCCFTFTLLINARISQHMRYNGLAPSAERMNIYRSIHSFKSSVFCVNFFLYEQAMFSSIHISIISSSDRFDWFISVTLSVNDHCIKWISGACSLLSPLGEKQITVL